MGQKSLGRVYDIRPSDRFIQKILHPDLSTPPVSLPFYSRSLNSLKSRFANEFMRWLKTVIFPCRKRLGATPARAIQGVVSKEVWNTQDKHGGVRPPLENFVFAKFGKLFVISFIFIFENIHLSVPKIVMFISRSRAP